MNAAELYKWLSDPANLKDYTWEKQNKGDGMSVISIWKDGWWKPIYLVDDRNKSAVQFMSMDGYLLTVSENDIDWSTVTEKLDGFSHAKSLQVRLSSYIRDFKDNVAYLEWKINLDGQYYMDDDGYGMTNDIEEYLFGFFGRDGSVVEPFRYIGRDWDQLKEMRTRAEKKYKELHK